MISKDPKPGARTASLQFSLRALLLLTLALAVLLAVYKSCRLMWAVGGLEFWIVLLMPLWLLLPFSRETTRGRLRPLLAIIPISWYVLMYVAPWERLWPRDTPFRVECTLNSAILLGGTVASLITLALAARGRQHLITLSLWIAILAGAGSMLLRTAGWWL